MILQFQTSNSYTGLSAIMPLVFALSIVVFTAVAGNYSPPENSSSLMRRTIPIYTRALNGKHYDSQYLICKIINDNTGTKKTVCSLADFLVRAIRLEYGLKENDQGLADARKIARQNKEHTFHFRNPRAFALVAPPREPRDVEQVRAVLSKFSNTELIARLSNFKTATEPSCVQENQEATAQVLVERDILPSCRCVGCGPFLWVYPEDQNEHSLNSPSASL